MCLQEIMVNNPEYNIHRRYNMYSIIPLGKRSKSGTAIAIRKDILHKN